MQTSPTTTNTDAAELRWMRRYNQLTAFVERTGRYPNATFATVEERALRSWCSTQRNAHSGLGTGHLTAERTRLLESIPGWSW
jgi:hypothetical protein